MVFLKVILKIKALGFGICPKGKTLFFWPNRFVIIFINH